LDKAIPANERGITCLAVDEKGRVFGGTTGRATHLFVYDPAKDEVRSLLRLDGGIGFAFALIRLPDGSLIAGTQADPTGIAVKTDPKAVGHLYRFSWTGEPGASAPGGIPIKVDDLGVAVPGQGIYTLAYLEKSQEIVGNTWPDGHFFVYDLKAKTFRDHGAIAGYRPFETPQHAEDVSRGTGKKVSYPRVVSRAIAVGHDDWAYTAGAGGFLYRYPPGSGKLERLKARLPFLAGREHEAVLDVVAPIIPRYEPRSRRRHLIVCSRSFLVLLDTQGSDEQHQDGAYLLGTYSLGSPITGAMSQNVVFGVAGGDQGIPRCFRLRNSVFEDPDGTIPRVDSQVTLVGFGAMTATEKYLYAGETDRLARLVRFPLKPKASGGRKPSESAGGEQKNNSEGLRPPLAEQMPPHKLPCPIAFAPDGTTTDGSGYTAIEVGRDGHVYVGSARYGDYAWLLRFDPAKKPLFMDKVASLRELTGERLSGVNTQGKLHAKIVVGPDGRIWFASKQGHEIFDTRPEYEDPNGYPGGHLCWFDPETGFSRSVGILKRREGLQGGVIDPKRGRIYLRSEPKNHFLVYDIASGDVQDRGHVGAACRYMAIDPNGVVYTMGRSQTLCRYDPETNYVEELRIRVDAASGGRQPSEFSPPYVLALAPNGKLYGAGTTHPWIMEFDVDQIRRAEGVIPPSNYEVTMRNIAPAAPPGLPVQDIHAGVFGKDGRFYYPLLTTGPLERRAEGVNPPRPEQHVLLMRFDPATRKVETIGVPAPQFDEEKVKHAYPRSGPHKIDHIQGMAVAEDGTLFMMDIYPQLNVVWFPQLTAKK
jgi:hypothetical protein